MLQDFRTRSMEWITSNVRELVHMIYFPLLQEVELYASTYCHNRLRLENVKKVKTCKQKVETVTQTEKQT